MTIKILTSVLLSLILIIGGNWHVASLDFNDVQTHTIGAQTHLDILYWDNPQICFDSSFHSNSFKELEKVAKFHNTYPTYLIEVGVHTDTRGDSTMNQKLSALRARNVLFELQRVFNVDTNMFVPRGYGESAPIHSDSIIANTLNRDQANKLHNKNSRTVIKLLKK